MHTIAVISQKGGAGKTTLAVHLAAAFARGGLDTALIDLDPQASAAKWGDRRESELPVVLSAHASRLANEMKRVEELGGEVLILDTAPHSDSAALEAARRANLVVVPCRPAILDIEAVASTLSLVGTTDTPVVVVMNGAAAQGNEAAEAEEAIRGMGAEVCPVRLTSRVAFARSLVTGHTAQEHEPDGKAAAEVAALHDFVCARLQVRKTARDQQPAAKAPAADTEVHNG